MTEPPAPAQTIPGVRLGADSHWLAVMGVLTAIEFGWWVIAWRAGIAPVPFVGTYLILTFAGLALTLAARLGLRMGRPVPSWPSIIAGTLLVAVGASLFLPLKYAIPAEIPFWLDRPLMVAERAVFGDDPWLVLDRILGWATRPIDWLYGCWLPTQLLIMFSVMLSRPSPAKSRALIAYSLGWFVLGTVAAALLSSAGPIFFDRAFGGSGFAELHDALHARGAWVAIAESDRMWASTGMDRPGLVAGISAMPSIHVAISLWVVLATRQMKPRFAPMAWAYFVLIWIGSVQLGWHYVSDGFVGALGMWVIWRLVGIWDWGFGRASPDAAVGLRD